MGTRRMLLRGWIGALLAVLVVVAAVAAAEGKKGKGDGKPKGENPKKTVQLASATPERTVRQALDEKVTLEFFETPLTDVFMCLQDMLKVQVRLDRKPLDEIGVAADVPITFSVKGVRLQSALDLMLRDLDLSWTIVGEVLLISSAEKVDQLLQPVVYDVHDLVAAHDERGKDFNDFDSIIEMITTTVRPTSWDRVGGPGSIAPFEAAGIHVLVINQTGPIHLQIETLLADLRRAKLDGADAKVPVKPRTQPPVCGSILGTPRKGAPPGKSEPPKCETPKGEPAKST